MGNERAVKGREKAVFGALLLGCITGYVLARLVRQPAPATHSPLSAVLQDSADFIADLRRSKSTDGNEG